MPSQCSWAQLGDDIDGVSSHDRSSSVAVSSDGTIVAVGARRNSNNGYRSGHTRIFQYQSQHWTQLGSDINGSHAKDRSGFSVALSNDGKSVAIGSPKNDENGKLSGLVRVYAYNGISWSQVGDNIAGVEKNDLFGSSLAISLNGLSIAVGAPQRGGKGKEGYVHVYAYFSNSWRKVGCDIIGEAHDDHFGTSVALSSDGRIVAVGAIENDANVHNSGRVRVFRTDGSLWPQLGETIIGEAAGDKLGQSVALSSDGKIIAVGAPHSDVNGKSNSGKVYVYSFGSSAWMQMGNSIGGEADNDKTGTSVDISVDGSIVAIGSPGNDAGNVRVYKFNGVSSWNQRGDNIVGEKSGDFSGGKVAMSSDGSKVFIGAARNNGSGKKAGHVRVVEQMCN